MSITEEDGSPRFSADQITGMFISMMFAGHHTTSGTAAWTLIELLRQPEGARAVDGELDELDADGAEVSYQALREMPRLESAAQGGAPAPPAAHPAPAGGEGGPRRRRVHHRAGQMVGASPSVSNRIAEDFPDAGRSDRRASLAPARRTDRTPGRGSPSVRAVTAASAPPSP